MKGKIQSKLINVTEKAMVPGEFKLAVYERYILPSVRYFLTVHNLLKPDLDVLDSITRSHIKLWLGIPKFGATALTITHPSGLNVRMPSQAYTEAQVLSLITMFLDTKDPVVIEAITNQKERESQWSHKQGITDTVAEIVESVSKSPSVITPINPHVPNSNPTVHDIESHHISLHKYKDAAKHKISNLFKNKAAKALGLLGEQGNLLKLLEEEKGDLNWLAMICKAPRGLLQFASRAIMDTLATPSNLARWNKVVDSSCRLCHRTPANLFHLLSGCKVALEQKHYNTRHDLVVEYIVRMLKENASVGTNVYVDLDRFRSHSSTLLLDLTHTAQKPDVVIVN